MEFLERLFFAHGAVQASLVLSLTIAFGILLGRIKIAGVSFGIGGILFSGIILGHFGFSLEPKVLVFTREFGLILFVYAIGIAVGPTFLESLRDKGLKLNLVAAFIVLTGAALAIICYLLFNLTIPQTAGLFSGAVTNTPSLGSANEAWSQTAASPELVSEGLKVIGMAYAVAYPFGIFGIILTMMLLKGMFHINVDAEIAQLAAAHKHEAVSMDSADHEIVFTNSALIGKNLADVLPAGVIVDAVMRKGEIHAVNDLWRLRLDDHLFLKTASESAFDEAKRVFGNNAASLSHPSMLAIFVGIFAGVFLGSIPVMVPGLPTGLKLGVAGGTLLTAIFLARAQRFCGMVFYMSPGAINLMREIGILLFLACVGLHAGTGFVETVVHGPGLYWMGIGAIITFVPLFLAALVCRACWKIDFPSICGMLAGSMTDPPALAFAMQYYGGEIAANSYSAVYPLTMIMRILMGQLLVIGLAIM